MSLCHTHKLTTRFCFDDALDEVCRKNRLLNAAVLHQVIREHEGAELLFHTTAHKHHLISHTHTLSLLGCF